MLDQKRLKQLLHYNHKTGVFKNRTNRTYNSKKGMVVGSINSGGYLHCRLDGQRYSMHRLAFLYMVGYFPEYSVDHKNGRCDDNKWDNLRHVTHTCNLQNQKTYKSNMSGFSGVSYCNGKWRSRGTYKGREINLGIYIDIVDAALARLSWEIQCHNWKCDCRGELVKAIKKSWLEFNDKCVS